MSAPTASAPSVANPWLRGPPQQVKAPPPGQAPVGSSPVAPNEQNMLGQQQNQPPLMMPGPQIVRPRIARAHHHLSFEEAQVHAYQLNIAQQFALAALQSGMDVGMYQAQVAMSYGFDPRILGMTVEHLEGTEPLLGLTLVRDEQAYTHIELLSRYPHVATINLTAVDLEPRRAAYFLVTCPERQVHESIKYGFWPISAEGAPALNRAFGEMHGLGPVYFLMASTDSVAFSGIAQMMGPATPNPENPEGIHRMPIRWIYCKNIPFSHMNHVALRPASREAEETRRLHGGMQPMKLNDGNRSLSIFARYTAGTSVLMDFKYYDEAEARGAVVESGDAAIRATQKSQQRMMQGGGGHYSGGRGGHFQPRPHYQQHPGGPSQSQPNLNPQQNPAAFPTPAQAVGGAVKAQEQTPPASTSSVTPAPQAPSPQPPQQQQQPFASRPSRPFAGERGAHRGGMQRSAPVPSRQILTADEERVTLQTKYVFAPVMKEKQNRRRRNKNAMQQGEEDEEGDGGAQQGEEEGQQQEGEQVDEGENAAQDVNGDE